MPAVPQINVQVTPQQHFFRSTGTILLSADIPLPSEAKPRFVALSRFVECFFSRGNALLDRCIPLSTSRTICRDYRGRPADSYRNSGDPEVAGRLRENEEELLFVRGNLFENPLPDTDSGASHVFPFEFSILSQFETFESGKHIAFRLLPKASPVFAEIFSELSPRLLGRLAPAELEEVRFGLEIYRSKSFGFQWGSVPLVERRFHLWIRETSLKIGAEDSYKGKFAVMPFEAEELLPHLDRSLSYAGLGTDFLSRVERAVSAST